MEKHVRIVAFGYIAVAGLLALAATFWATWWLVLAALLAMLGGWGLLRLYPWAVPLVMVLAAVTLVAFPVGTVFGGYGLWVLFSDGTKKLFLPDHDAPDVDVATGDSGSRRFLTATFEWGWWRIVKTMLALVHSAAVLAVALGLVMLYASPPPPGPDLGPVMAFISFAVLGLPWSIPVYVLAETGTGRPHASLIWTLLILTSVLNTGLLWFWALRRKRRHNVAHTRS